MRVHAETEREFCVKADVPGVNKDNLKVYQDGDVLSISAVRPMFICTMQYCRPFVLRKEHFLYFVQPLLCAVLKTYHIGFCLSWYIFQLHGHQA